MRTGLAALTFVLVMYIVVVREGRLSDDTQFWTVVISLVIVTVLAADECRSVVPLWRSLGVRPETFAQQISDLQALPWTAYHAVAPGLEKLAGMIRGDSTTGTPPTKVLKGADYSTPADVPTLGEAGGKTPDKDKFAAMKLEYKQIVYLLCRMKSLEPATHDILVTAMGACT